MQLQYNVIMRKFKPVYYLDTQELFKDFLSITESGIWYFGKYKDNIKEFFKDHLNININIYFSKSNNVTYWYYLIEHYDEIYTSDDNEIEYMTSYNEALNKSIQFILTQVFKTNNQTTNEKL